MLDNSKYMVYCTTKSNGAHLNQNRMKTIKTYLAVAAFITATLITSNVTAQSATTISYELEQPTITRQGADVIMVVTVPANVAAIGGTANVYLYENTLNDTLQKTYSSTNQKITPSAEGSKQLTFVVKNVRPGSYFSRAAVAGNDGNFYWSAATWTNLDLASSVNSLENAKIQAYPNPATTHVTITGLSLDGQVRVINASGQTVITELVTQTAMKLDLSTLPSGMYFIQLFDGNTSDWLKKILKE